MELKKLKLFLNNYGIKLYDEQYRILAFFINKKSSQIGGGSNNFNNILGNTSCEIFYKIGEILKY
ncbi:hypothetical protein crov211 [Cafeteria roenbergensis virus]|uniref:Uncharacterized protein n=1 Tax=Cafeteria roenbergensis virus (strain BV-PW1) TaxID=693272 RepID=E3T4Y1_CROVB|nr:hypothetical protein crov211 [Cafeteria roenbergensis virus BV-PW1]ADO67244.1 hypothetical protein crov211 [Cafeteria roenbergensis virus BV-PW1]